MFVECHPRSAAVWDVFLWWVGCRFDVLLEALVWSALWLPSLPLLYLLGRYLMERVGAGRT